MQLLSEAVEVYSDFLRYQSGYATTTVCGYISWLRAYQRWLGESGYPQPSLGDFSASTLTRYLHSMTRRNCRPRTVRSAFNPLRSFGDYLCKNGTLSENPAREVVLPRKDAAVRLRANEGDIEALLQAAERLPDLREAVMAKAVLSCLAYGGLRRMEVLSLHVSDVDTEAGSILIRSGKGSKSRKIFVCSECVTALKEWLSVRRADSERLWVLRDSRYLGEVGLMRLFNSVKAVAGLRAEKGLTPHCLRHAAASRLLRNGANLGAISTFLGHSQISTTEIYLHVDEEDLRRVAELTGFRKTREAPAKPDTSRKAYFLSRRSR